MGETYLSEADFCSRFHVKPRTAQRWRQTGIGGPAYVRVGLRRVAYRMSDCERWAASHTFRHRADELSRQAA